jgi:hypothetical protein
MTDVHIVGLAITMFIFGFFLGYLKGHKDGGRKSGGKHEMG